MSAHLSAVELLNLGNDDRATPFLNKIWPQLLGVTFGVGSALAINFGTRRPLFSGIQKHILGVVVWTTALTFVEKKRVEFYAEKDAVMRHYVELHPEDFKEHFPQTDRKKLSDVFEPWIPIR